nr:Myb-like transcriptional factor [Trichoderma decipiens]
MAPARKQSRWSTTEDEILMKHVRVQERNLHHSERSRDWNSIASKLPGRSNKDCRKRWLKICGSIKKGEWHADEDEKLRNAVRIHGYRWVQVARHIGTRSADHPNIKRYEWTKEEDIRLLKAYQLYGSNWKTIQVLELPNRALQDLRNRHRSISKFYGNDNLSRPTLSDSNSNNSEHQYESNSSYSGIDRSCHLLNYVISHQQASDPSTPATEIIPDADGKYALIEKFELYKNDILAGKLSEQKISSWTSTDIIRLDTIADLSARLDCNVWWPSDQYLSQIKTMYAGDGYGGHVANTNTLVFDGTEVRALDPLVHALTTSLAGSYAALDHERNDMR